jgi:hypothetical protein
MDQSTQVGLPRMVTDEAGGRTVQVLYNTVQYLLEARLFLR